MVELKTTIKDVAALAGVSISTVSRVMNNPETVVQEKREKVLAAIEELNYHPNALARGLIYKRTNTYGVLITDVSNMYSAEVLKGMEEAANKRGMNVIICNTDLDKGKMAAYLNVLKEKQVDGILYTSEPVFEDDYRLLQSLNVPVVLVSTESTIYPLASVKINDVQAGFDATRYLIEHGHCKIGMVSGPATDVIAGEPRYSGYVKALAESNIEINHDLFVEHGDYRFHGGYEAMKRLLNKNKDITAVFVASDEMALGAISYMREVGIKVPEEISVIGFDNTKVSYMSIPKLTTVAQPMFDIGYTAVEKLEQLISHGSVEELRTYLPHEIKERASVITRK